MSKHKKKLVITPSPKAKANPHVFWAKVRGVCLFIGALILGWGLPEMIAGQEYAPYLISIGALASALIVVSDDDIRSWLSRIVRSKWVRFSLYLVFCLIFVLIPYMTSERYANTQREILARTPIFFGELTPGDSPNPNTLRTDIPSDKMILMIGDGSVVTSSQSGSYILSHKGKPFLSVSANEEGNIVLNTEVQDSTNNNVVRIVNNEFQANPNYAFRPIQPDKHSLIVRDSEGNEVLNMKYINRKVIRIVGRFYLPGYHEPIVLSSDGTVLLPGNNRLSHFYFDNVGTAIEIGG